MPLVANPDFYHIIANGTLAVPPSGFLTNDFDTNGTLQPFAVISPSHASSFSAIADGSFTYVPNAGFIGDDTFTYFITDGTSTASAIDTIEVYHPALVANPDAYTVAENGTLTVPASGFLTNDIALNGTLQAFAVISTSHGSLVAIADGSFTYVPNPGFTGNDTFTYFVTDGVTQVSATDTITVTTTSVAAPDFYT